MGNILVVQLAYLSIRVYCEKSIELTKQLNDTYCVVNY